VEGNTPTICYDCNGFGIQVRERVLMVSFKRGESALESIVGGLPDDIDRIQILKILIRHGDPMPLGMLADSMGQSSDLIAEILVGAAKDGLVSFSADSRYVSLTDLGRKIASRTVASP
jgi:hypothetical protein